MSTSSAYQSFSQSLTSHLGDPSMGLVSIEVLEGWPYAQIPVYGSVSGSASFTRSPFLLSSSPQRRDLYVQDSILFWEGFLYYL